MQVIFFDNGSTAVCDAKGKQIPELQEPYILLFANFLKEKGIDPLNVDFVMPNSKRANLFTIPDGYNWNLKGGES